MEQDYSHWGKEYAKNAKLLDYTEYMAITGRALKSLYLFKKIMSTNYNELVAEDFDGLLTNYKSMIDDIGTLCLSLGPLVDEVKRLRGEDEVAT